MVRTQDKSHDGWFVCCRRNMFEDLEKDCNSVAVSENGASFAMLVDAMYAPDRKGPLTGDCIYDLSGKEFRPRCMIIYQTYRRV